MKLIEAQRRIEKLAYIPFSEYLSPSQVQDAMMKINKGRTGQLLELTIGLNLSNTTLDFEDGELKQISVTEPENHLKLCSSPKPHLLSMNCLQSAPLKIQSCIKKFSDCYMYLSVKMVLPQTGCICNLSK